MIQFNAVHDIESAWYVYLDLSLTKRLNVSYANIVLASIGRLAQGLGWYKNVCIVIISWYVVCCNVMSTLSG